MTWQDLLVRTQSALCELWRGEDPQAGDRFVRTPLDLDELESRILMSATPLALDIVNDLDQTDTDDLANDVFEAATDPDFALSSDEAPPHSEAILLVENDAAENHATDVRHEIVFVDTSIDDYQQLIGNLSDSGDNPRQLDVILLDPSSNGIEQIGEALADSDQLDALHIISHGNDSEIRLGNEWLNADRLDAYAGKVALWGNSLNADADILLYGCDIAATPDGQVFIDGLSALTGADVAASVDATGHQLLGGNWDLEFEAGEIQTDGLLTSYGEQSWHHLLYQETIRDSFSWPFYSGNDGSQDWDDRWTEVNEATHALFGHVRVVDRVEGLAIDWALRFDAADGFGIYRDFNLDDAISATLSFDWELDTDLGFEGTSILVQLSIDSGNSWDTVDTVNSGSGQESGSPEIDLSSYLVDNARLRLLATGDGTGYAYFDNIQIGYEVTPPNTAPTLNGAAALTLSPISEDQSVNNGNSVAEVLAGDGTSPIADIDTGALEGIAVTSVDTDHGIWEYDAAADGNWQSFDTVGDESAVLLGPSSRIRFVSNEDYFGQGASISFRAWDQTSGVVGDTQINSTIAGGTNAFSTDQATATIDVLPVNDAPRTAGIDDIFVKEDARPTKVDVFAAFQDPEQCDEELKYSLVDNSQPELFSNLRFDAKTGILTFRHAADMHGESAITIRATDAEGLSVDEQFKINVESVNDAPVSSVDTYKVHGDEVLRIQAPGILENDYDVDGDLLAAVLIDGPQHGELKFRHDGTFQYIPDPSFLGWDSFTYRAADGDAFSDLERVLIRVLVPKSPVETSEDSEEPIKDTEDQSSSGLFEGLIAPATAELPGGDDGNDHAFRDRQGDQRMAVPDSTADLNSPAGISLQRSFQQSDVGSIDMAGSQFRSSTWTRYATNFANSVQTHVELASMAVVESGVSDFDMAVMCSDLDTLEKYLSDDGVFGHWVVESALGLTTGLTVGYVFWSVRAGYLLTSLIAQVPAWRIIDPLPILDSLDSNGIATDTESLQTIVHSEA